MATAVNGHANLAWLACGQLIIMKQSQTAHCRMIISTIQKQKKKQVHKTSEFKMTHQALANRFSLFSLMVTRTSAFLFLRRTLCVKIMSTYSTMGWWVNNAKRRCITILIGLVFISNNNAHNMWLEFSVIKLVVIFWYCMRKTSSFYQLRSQLWYSSGIDVNKRTVTTQSCSLL